MATLIPLILLLFCSFSLGQYFPSTPQGLKHITSHIPGASLSYKQTNICNSTTSYTGYIHLPPNPTDASPHPSNIYFFYTESRHDPSSAPLTVYLGGGPGASSISSMFTEVGACTVNDDSNTTAPNPWAWNRVSNMLFLDQPVQTGFSYDVLTNSTVDYTTAAVVPGEMEGSVPGVNATFGVGVFGSGDLNGTVNSTTTGARVFWDVLQVWMVEFPEYNSTDNHINIWTESFGGRYGPSYTSYILDQNKRIQAGQLDAHQIHVDSLGIHNGCSDVVTEGSFYPEFAYRNTYGVKVISKEIYEASKHNFTKPGGCLDLALQCKELADRLDPLNVGNDVQVNELCVLANQYCYVNVLGGYVASGRDIHDMAAVETVTVPSPYSDGFLNRAWVQEELGVPVNFTANSNTVYNAFGTTGNALILRGNAMDEFASILAHGVKVNLVYGDRDYLCNWMGGENISLSIKHKQSRAFQHSGYQALITNSSYVGGVVRQHGNLSFTRVFDAGHAAVAYQPETFFRIFSRIMASKDIATGEEWLIDDYSETYRTRGPHSSFGVKNVMPEPAEPVCYTLDMMTTCTEGQKEALVNGTAVVRDFVVVEPK
ncbi:carboxypeptidase S1 [Aspergillus steynii IBT 23096]|uniref:Carboxypeptidase S1 n=1 Tax=Aspergillus steynii IBT 23096 TaxID=1392250 RepID=A0A2I2FVX7_9EURO|nr:carboxypeptidase S1 [Aspergillus steynii IBT 23096]PLB44803.1 carboxypeptidase S1 [Aspergillus steynii IBT 23096]